MIRFPEMYGPNRALIEELLRRLEVAEQEDEEEWKLDRAYDHLLAAIYVAGRGTPEYLVSKDVEWAVRDRARERAVRHAATALVMADMIGQHGFTQEHFDVLTRAAFLLFGDPREARS